MFQMLIENFGFQIKQSAIPLEKKVLSTLWVLANQESFRSVADRFNMSKGTLHSLCMDVCHVLVQNQNEHVKWPNNYEDVADAFEQRRGFPGVIGAIDGTHIPLVGVGKDRASFINRKGFLSLQLQATCTSDLKFTDLVCGWPGSVHDARVFRNSPLADMLPNLPQHKHIVGDSAYPLRTYLLVPYKDNGHLTASQKNFNKKLNSTRVDIERAFGLLKCRFRRLKFLDMRSMEKIPIVIVAACVLHNMLLNLDFPDEEELQAALLAEQQAQVHQQGQHINRDIQNHREAILKRRQLTEQLA